MVPNHVERHHRRDLTIERQALAEREQVDEIHVGNVQRLVRIGFVRMVSNMRERGTRGHESVARRRWFDFGLRAHAHVLFVGHAGLFETARTRCQPGNGGAVYGGERGGKWLLQRGWWVGGGARVGGER